EACEQCALLRRPALLPTRRVAQPSRARLGLLRGDVDGEHPLVRRGGGLDVPLELVQLAEGGERERRVLVVLAEWLEQCARLRTLAAVEQALGEPPPERE